MPGYVTDVRGSTTDASPTDSQAGQLGKGPLGCGVPQAGHGKRTTGQVLLLLGGELAVSTTNALAAEPTKKKDAPLGGVQVAPRSVACGLKVLTVICGTITAQVY